MVVIVIAAVVIVMVVIVMAAIVIVVVGEIARNHFHQEHPRQRRRDLAVSPRG